MMRPRTLHVSTIDITAHCFLRPWFQRLRSLGAEVAVACNVTDFRDSLEQCADQVIDVAIPRRIRPLGDLLALVRLIRLFRKMRPDVIHTHTSKAGFLGRLAGRITGVPLVIHTVHELPENSARDPLVKRLYRELERCAEKWAHHLITVSYVNQEQLLGSGLTRPEKLTVVRNGLALEDYEGVQPDLGLRERLGIPAQAGLVGTAARMEPAKDYPTLLKAFRKVLNLRPDSHLVCAGMGDHSPFAALAGDLGVADRVHFAGFVPDLPALIASLDVFVLSSHFEGQGVVLLEAMALEKPVISTAVGGTVEVVVDGKTGYLVPHEDADALADRMVQLLASPELRSRLGAAGVEWVRKEFRLEASLDQLQELYFRLWEARFPGRRWEVR